MTLVGDLDSDSSVDMSEFTAATTSYASYTAGPSGTLTTSVGNYFSFTPGTAGYYLLSAGFEWEQSTTNNLIWVGYIYVATTAVCEAHMTPLRVQDATSTYKVRTSVHTFAYVGASDSVSARAKTTTSSGGKVGNLSFLSAQRFS